MLSLTVILIFGYGIKPALKVLPAIISSTLILPLSLPGSLVWGTLPIYLNGVRRIAGAPGMLLLEASAAQKGSAKLFSTVLGLSVIIQLPASLLLSFFRTGSLLASTGQTFRPGLSGREEAVL